jgi:cell division protein FtsW
MLSSALVYQAVPARLHAHELWIAVGLLLGAGLSLVPYTWWRRPWVLNSLIVLALLLLGAVMIPGLGVMRNGARRWLPFGQPSELAKIVLVLALADYGDRHQSRMREFGVGMAKPGILLVAMAGLIFLEPDWGSAALTCMVAMILLCVAGADWFYMVSCVLIAVMLGIWCVLHNAMRYDRVLSFLNPEAYQGGIGFQQWRSMLAIALGGFWGHSFGEGRFKGGFVPEQDTDFLLSLIGEETGLVGSHWIVLLYVCILVLGCRIAWRVADPYGQLVVVGITFLIALQAFINMGVVTALLPNKGLPLPFVSYGGSNLVSLLAALGILANIAWRGPTRPGQ